MKGFFYRLTSLGLLIALICSVFSPASFANEPASIVIVKSSENSYYQKTIETLINHIDIPARYKSITVNQLANSTEIIRDADLYIALGIQASNAITNLADDTPLINAYITREQYNLEVSKDTSRDQISLVLDQPLERYFTFVFGLLNPESIGLMSSTPLQMNAGQLKLAENSNTTITQYHPQDRSKLLSTLRILTRENDVLLMLPDKKIYNRDTLKGILLTSYRSRKPVISYSPAHVKSGALASIYSSPIDIGKHIAERAIENIKNKKQPLRGFEYARFYSISDNKRVAHALGIDLPDLSQMRSFIDKGLK